MKTTRLSDLPTENTCTHATHAALKALPWLWALLPRGRHGSVQTWHFGDQVEIHELRDCSCGSTLMMPLAVGVA